MSYFKDPDPPLRQARTTSLNHGLAAARTLRVPLSAKFLLRN